MVKHCTVNTSNPGSNPGVDVIIVCINIVIWFIKIIIKFIMQIISGLSSLLALGLLTPVQSILCLIILFISTSFCLYSNGFVLMAILYVLIYVGAIAILFLFILSLLKIEYHLPERVSAFKVACILVLLIPLDLGFDNISITTISHNINNELVSVGNQLFTEYAIIILLVAIILVLSVIGAIAITR